MDFWFILVSLFHLDAALGIAEQEARRVAFDPLGQPLQGCDQRPGLG
jgi:hypothetical protein